MKIKSHILTLLAFLFGLPIYAQTIEFVENKGQWDDRVRYMGQVSNGAFFIHNNGFTVLQQNASDVEKLHERTHARMLSKPEDGPLVLRSHSYNVQFLESNPKARIEADKPLPTINNYFIGDDPAKWGSACRVFQGVTIRDIYPNIDIRYYADKGTLKYDLIVRPGGNVSDIALKYAGADRLSIRNRELVISTSVGELKELAPYTYQYGEKGKATIGAKYILKDDVVRFDVDRYDPSSILVIDPTLIFCSFTGSTADNWGFTATYGPDGSMYGGGIVFGAGFPVSPGAFQTNFANGTACLGMTGGFDIGIIKLSPNGSTRMYATYLGGSGSEMPHSLIVDAQGNLIVAGRTNSPVDGPGSFPVAGAGKIGNNLGGWDIIVTKFNATGSGVIGSVRIGGSNDDGANIDPCNTPSPLSLQQNYGDEGRGEVNLDAAENIYVASSSKSTNFPIVGGFQTTSGGKQDGIILKFTPNLSALSFSSYIGGPENDATYVVSVRNNGDIYVAGGTESQNIMAGTRAGTIGPNFSGGTIDGYVAIIANNGSSVLKSTYLGTGGIDQVYGIKFDRSGFPYVMGQTTGSWPVTPGVWSTPNGRQFIAKLQPDLSAYIYSTVFGKTTGAGGSPDISPVAFLVDRCENVYVSGWGGRLVSNYPNDGVEGLPVTPDAIKPVPDIDPANGKGRDFYFFVLKKNATQQLYGSFFGQNGPLGDHVDGGTSRFDEDGVIYQAICASCSNNGPFPTTPGVWAPTKPTTALCNLAMVKIAFNLAGVGSGVQSFIDGVPRDTAGCVPLTVDFKDTVLAAVSYEWNFGDGSPQITTTTPNATHTYLSTGTFKVMLVAIDSTTCNIRDTSFMYIKVGATEAFPDFQAVKLNPCDSFKYRFDNLSIAPPGFPFKSNSFTWDFGDGTPKLTTGPGSVFHTYASPGTRTVKLYLNDTTYCNSPDSVVKTINVAMLVKAGFKTPATGCVPYNAQFTDTSHGGTQFLWDFGDGSAGSTLQNPTHLYTTPGTYTITLIVTDSGTCNIKDTATVTITVVDNPVADFSIAPQPPITNTPISFTNLSSTNAVRFKWLFGDGDSLVTTSRNIVQHEYNKTGSWNACLIAYNQAGCSDTLCRPVEALIDAAVDVPNAFTPGQSGANSIIYVRGFGIAKMKFAIYNRYGVKVFETNTKTVGWDGKFKGKAQPMDVYAYTLDVEFTDGTKARRTGDISLIR